MRSCILEHGFTRPRGWVAGESRVNRCACKQGLQYVQLGNGYSTVPLAFTVH